MKTFYNDKVSINQENFGHIDIYVSDNRTQKYTNQMLTKQTSSDAENKVKS